MQHLALTRPPSARLTAPPEPAARHHYQSLRQLTTGLRRHSPTPSHVLLHLSRSVGSHLSSLATRAMSTGSMPAPTTGPTPVAGPQRPGRAHSHGSQHLPAASSLLATPSRLPVSTPAKEIPSSSKPSPVPGVHLSREGFFQTASLEQRAALAAVPARLLEEVEPGEQTQRGSLTAAQALAGAEELLGSEYGTPPDAAGSPGSTYTAGSSTLVGSAIPELQALASGAVAGTAPPAAPDAELDQAAEPAAEATPATSTTQHTPPPAPAGTMPAAAQPPAASEQGAASTAQPAPRNGIRPAAYAQRLPLAPTAPDSAIVAIRGLTRRSSSAELGIAHAEPSAAAPPSQPASGTASGTAATSPALATSSASGPVTSLLARSLSPATAGLGLLYSSRSMDRPVAGRPVLMAAVGPPAAAGSAAAHQQAATPAAEQAGPPAAAAAAPAEPQDLPASDALLRSATPQPSSAAETAAPAAPAEPQAFPSQHGSGTDLRPGLPQPPAAEAYDVTALPEGALQALPESGSGVEGLVVPQRPLPEELGEGGGGSDEGDVEWPDEEGEAAAAGAAGEAAAAGSKKGKKKKKKKKRRSKGGEAGGGGGGGAAGGAGGVAALAGTALASVMLVAALAQMSPEADRPGEQCGTAVGQAVAGVC